LPTSKSVTLSTTTKKKVLDGHNARARKINTSGPPSRRLAAHNGNNTGQGSKCTAHLAERTPHACQRGSSERRATRKPKTQTNASLVTKPARRCRGRSRSRPEPEATAHSTPPPVRREPQLRVASHPFAPAAIRASLVVFLAPPARPARSQLGHRTARQVISRAPPSPLRFTLPSRAQIPRPRPRHPHSIARLPAADPAPIPRGWGPATGTLPTGSGRAVFKFRLPARSPAARRAESRGPVLRLGRRRGC
jgi:hypothetical protein